MNNENANTGQAARFPHKATVRDLKAYLNTLEDDALLYGLFATKDPNAITNAALMAFFQGPLNQFILEMKLGIVPLSEDKQETPEQMIAKCFFLTEV